MLLLVGAVAVLYALALPLAISQQGLRGAAEAGAAALLCLLPAATALGLSYRLIGTPQAFAALALAMGLRLMPPLAIVLILATRGTGADFMPFICYLLVFYLATLAVETWLFVRIIQAKK